MLLSQDEARFQMVPTLQTTLGVKGHRPVVGTRDCKDVLYVFAVMNLIAGTLHTNTLILRYESVMFFSSLSLHGTSGTSS